MGRGYLISFEGLDGCGKTTQIHHLKKLFEENNENVVIIREPGGTNLGESIREILLKKRDLRIDLDSEILLFLASRAQMVKEIILPELDQGTIILCERYIDSTLTYQGYGRNGDKEFIDLINKYVIKGCLPELTFYFDISIDALENRIKGRNQKQTKSDVFDRIEQENREFKQRVETGYQELLMKHPERIIKIDATKSEDEITSVLWKIVQKKLNIR